MSKIEFVTLIVNHANIRSENYYEKSKICRYWSRVVW